MIPFTHLHVHSQYSILDGAASVNALVSKAKKDGMSALALTDHGKMFGIKEFHATCSKMGIKPILGCETYVAARSIKDKKDKVDRSGHHLILLAKNKTGYKNLVKLISIASNEGFYYKPRIDKEILEKYSEGLIASSACLGGEVPQELMTNNFKEAENVIQWYKRVFGDDYYLELQRHPAEELEQRQNVYDNQVNVNKLIVPLAKKYGVKIIATNDVHFTNAEDADAHDLLICLNTGKDLDDPNRMRYTKQEWFKTQAEMNHLFSDIPEALTNTAEIAEKVEEYKLDSSPIMPVFPIPEEIGTEEGFRKEFPEEKLRGLFGGDAFDRLGGYDKVLRVKLESAYLTHLTYEGAKVRYGDPLEESVSERLDFELDTIEKMGYPGYFLITQDFINWAKEKGVLVGPGRGSAAGAAVAYCTGITNIDPIKYDLLFERFLNPDRVSLPDVDIDFDDDGRQMVLDYVTNKYGQDKVAHICTFGTMATKLAIRDVARVMKLPLPEADRLAKLVPDAPKMTFKKAYKESPDLLREKTSSNPIVAQTMKFAETLEGSIRQTGVHACGILISRDPLSDHIPLMPTKEENLYTTQYDGRFVEDIGLLKMDFLGLKTLSIIKETLENIRLSKGIEIDIDNIPMDDVKTYEMLSRGESTAIFQFESDGMKKHMRDLKPNRFEDLVAMNALYRPGPMQYIPDYIARKHGRQKVEYDLPMMKKYLSETYGITVFQEQVMLLSRLLANFTRGDSDTLRKAMGKKIIAVMNKLKVKFVEGCKANFQFIDECKATSKKVDDVIEKIWKDWEAFAEYAFNKSHSVCYAQIAYQTGYLKAHFPAEFMAANLSRNLSNIADITKLMTECQRMKLNVLGPDVNESFIKFTANKNGDLRFGMGAIKGVGAGAVQNIIDTREEYGEFKNIYDVVENVSLHTVNKKNLEGLAMAGAFDGFGENVKRSSFFAGVDENDSTTFIEKLIRYGNLIQLEAQSAQQSLFGGMESSQVIKKPEIPNVEEWAKLILLEKEKNLIGIYLTAHPLDDYRLELRNFCTRDVTLTDINNDIEKYKDKEFTFGGMVTAAREGTSKNGNPYSTLTMSDYTDSKEFFFFGQDYVNFHKYCKPGLFIMVKGTVRTRFKSDFYEFKVKQIELLSEVKKNYIKSVTINLPLHKLNESVIKEIDSLSQNNIGNAVLKFNVYDPENNMQIQMFSRTVKVTLSDDFLKFFEADLDIGYRIN